MTVAPRQRHVARSAVVTVASALVVLVVAPSLAAQDVPPTSSTTTRGPGEIAPFLMGLVPNRPAAGSIARAEIAGSCGAEVVVEIADLQWVSISTHGPIALEPRPDAPPYAELDLRMPEVAGSYLVFVRCGGVRGPDQRVIVLPAQQPPASSPSTAVPADPLGSPTPEPGAPQGAEARRADPTYTG